MDFDLPDVFEHDVHGPAVVELLLELDALASHLDADEHVQQGLGQALHRRVGDKQPLAVKPAHNNNIRCGINPNAITYGCQTFSHNTEDYSFIYTYPDL